MTTEPLEIHRQQGTALVIGMIILLLMTLIGVTSIQTTSLDERMAGNSRDHNLAFQAAEAALRDAENLPAADFKAALTTVKPDPNDDGAWENERSMSKKAEVQGVANQPTYVIALIPGSDSLCSAMGPECGLYQVTSRGYGATTGAIVVLQTTIGRDLDEEE